MKLEANANGVTIGCVGLRALTHLLICCLTLLISTLYFVHARFRSKNYCADCTWGPKSWALKDWTDINVLHNCQIQASCNLKHSEPRVKGRHWKSAIV